jgi:transposase-like protein
MERASREIWAKRVERWQDSGLTAKEFAAELDVSPNSLTFWKWKLRQPNNTATPRPRRKREAKQADAPASFLQLLPTPTSPPRNGHFEVVFAGGVVVRVPHDFDESALRRLASVLGGC